VTLHRAMSAARTPFVTTIAAASARRTLTALAAVAAVGLVAAGCSHPAPPPLAPLPRAVFADYLAGKLQAYEGEWDTAADALAEAAAAAPDQPMIAVELARLQMKAKRTPEAIATLARARVRWPDHPQVWRRATCSPPAIRPRPAAPTSGRSSSRPTTSAPTSGSPGCSAPRPPRPRCGS
jgi:hypothetical protein